MFNLNKTCNACPEQYNVYLDGVYVGYMRLRHGYFRVDNAQGITVYSAEPRGDGIFKEDERTKFLNAGCRAIEADLKNKEKEEEPLFEINEERALYETN